MGMAASSHRRSARDADRQLVADMLLGDQRAFDAFFRRYAPPLATFISRHSRLDPWTIEDVVQVCVLKAIRGLHDFRGESALFTWLCGICRYELVDVTRRAAREPEQLSLEGSAEARQLVSIMQTSSPAAPDSDEVLSALHALPARYAEALEMKYGGGFSIREVAAALGVSVIAAQSLLKRARDAFRFDWQDALR
jgi:RNA polymerase sigma-70 factor (ECF subfamily)